MTEDRKNLMRRPSRSTSSANKKNSGSKAAEAVTDDVTDRKNALKSNSSNNSITLGFFAELDQIKEDRDESLRDNTFASAADVGNNDSGNNMDSVADHLETEFDVFELPIDTDVKGDVDAEAGTGEAVAADRYSMSEFEITNAESSIHTSIESPSANESLEKLFRESIGTKTASTGQFTTDLHPASNGFSSETVAWPPSPNGHEVLEQSKPEIRVRKTVDKRNSSTVPGPANNAKPRLFPDKTGKNRSDPGAPTFSNNVWGKKARNEKPEGRNFDSPRTRELNDNDGRDLRGGFSREKKTKQRHPTEHRGRIFGTKTQARRERKERGLAAAASSLLVDRSARIANASSRTVLLDTISKNSVVDLNDHPGRDETYRSIPNKLPRFWSSKLVDCDVIDGRHHRVMFLWHDREGALFVYDTASHSISGSEIEAHYINWELSPSSFAKYLNNNRTYPDATGRPRGWRFARNKRD